MKMKAILILALALLSLVAIAGMASATFSEDVRLFQSKGIGIEIPDQYYLSLPCPGQTVGGVQETLGLITRPYVNGTFDCSNMASYVQWVLKSHGYDAKICTSDHFKGNGCHAWVEVDLDGITYYIDATDPILFLMGPWNANYKDYDHPERVYSGLHDTINAGYQVAWFRWWT